MNETNDLTLGIILLLLAAAYCVMLAMSRVMHG